MQTDTITWGETYDLEVSAQDPDGAAILLDGSWQAACRITKSKLGVAAFLDPVLTLSGGKARGQIDTGDAPWAPGTYYYDIRLTDPDGHDQWYEPVKLILATRNTPAS